MVAQPLSGNSADSLIVQIAPVGISGVQFEFAVHLAEGHCMCDTENVLKSMKTKRASRRGLNNVFHIAWTKQLQCLFT